MLRNVEKKGVGAHIDCSMLGSLLGISALQTSEYFGNNIPPERLGSAHPRNAPYQAFEASDTYFIIAAGNDKLWKQVCEAVSMPELINDDRFINQSARAKNQKKLDKILSLVFKKSKASYWLLEMDRRKVPCAPINNFSKILKDDHVKHMGLIKPIKLKNGGKTSTIVFPINITGVDTKSVNSPPELGEHNNEVVSEWLDK